MNKKNISHPQYLINILMNKIPRKMSPLNYIDKLVVKVCFINILKSRTDVCSEISSLLVYFLCKKCVLPLFHHFENFSHADHNNTMQTAFEDLSFIILSIIIVPANSHEQYHTHLTQQTWPAAAWPMTAHPMMA